MSLSKPSSYLTFGFLGGSLIYKLLNRKQRESDKLQQIENLELAILAVASVQYGVTLRMNDVRRVQKWRYFDWLITTPMLLRTLHLLAEEKGYTGSFAPALGADIIMITAGYVAEYDVWTTDEAYSKRNRQVAFGVSLVAFGVILFYVKEWIDYLKEQGVDVENLEYFFYIGWSGYGLNFLNPNSELRQTAFNILDLFNKGIYAIQLTNVVDSI